MIDGPQNFNRFCVEISPALQNLRTGKPLQILASEKIFASKGFELSISEIDGGADEGARTAVEWSEGTKQDADVRVLYNVCAVPVCKVSRQMNAGRRGRAAHVHDLVPIDLNKKAVTICDAQTRVTLYVTMVRWHPAVSNLHHFVLARTKLHISLQSNLWLTERGM